MNVCRRFDLKLASAIDSLDALWDGAEKRVDVAGLEPTGPLRVSDHDLRVSDEPGERSDLYDSSVSVWSSYASSLLGWLSLGVRSSSGIKESGLGRKRLIAGEGGVFRGERLLGLNGNKKET